jgi:DNA-binding response OmpR family regulator
MYIQNEKPTVGHRIRIDRQTHMVWVDDREIHDMPRLEYKLLEYLEKRRGQVCTRKQIVQYLYPNEKLSGVSNNAIDSIIKRLRKKIEPDTGATQFISTVHGVGFRLVDGDITEERQGSG